MGDLLPAAALIDDAAGLGAGGRCGVLNGSDCVGFYIVALFVQEPFGGVLRFVRAGCKIGDGAVLAQLACIGCYFTVFACTAADTRWIGSKSIRFAPDGYLYLGISGNRNIGAVSIPTATDACAIITTNGCYIAALDGDVGALAASTAANAGTPPNRYRWLSRCRP